MDRTTMPIPPAFEVLGPAAKNYPDDFTLPPVVIARAALKDYKTWLRENHPGFNVPDAARTRTVEVPNYGRVEITLEDGVRTPLYDRYNEPTPQWFVWAVYDTQGTKLAEEKWQR